MGTHPMFESDFDCLTDKKNAIVRQSYHDFLARWSFISSGVCSGGRRKGCNSRRHPRKVLRGTWGRKKGNSELQEERTIRKICSIDSHISLAFAGLTADARVMIDRVRTECQQHRLTVEDAVTVEYVTRYLANLKQKYTQSNGRRPFGISALVVGFDPHTKLPHLFTTDPAGTYSEWKANAIGRSSKTVREFLEKNYKDEKQTNDEDALKLACQALLEVVQSSSKNIELAIMRDNSHLELFR